jgi:predicted transcriptional regulator
MPKGLRPKLAQDKIDKIIELSQQGVKQKDIAAELKINVRTVGKYIDKNSKELYSNKDNKTVPPSLSVQDYTDRNKKCQEVDKKNIEILRDREEQTETEKEGGKQSNNGNQVEEKKKYYTNRLDKLITLLLQRYENDYYRIHPNFLSRDIGIFIDKFNILTGTNPTIDNRSIIFASFGDNKEMLKMIEAIQSSKGKK